MASDKVLGAKGEEIATAHLRKHGYRILHRNWIWNHKELDIVCQKDNLLIVVEVKTRANEAYERPQDAVTLKKQRNITEATQAYMDTYQLENEVRFDVISVLLDKQQKKLEHIQDAFHPFEL
jgi:putative endonuclease